MQTEFEDEDIAPKELERGITLEEHYAHSFKELHDILNSHSINCQDLLLQPRRAENKSLNKEEMDLLKKIHKAFELHKQLRCLTFRNLELDHLLIANAFKAAIKNNRVSCIWFDESVDDTVPTYLETVCQGFQEKSTPFELHIFDWPGACIKPVIEASYLKCFSLEIIKVEDCSKLELGPSLKTMFSRGRLIYIRLTTLKGLKEKIFLELARCVATIENLKVLELNTNIPVSGLKRLHGSLEKILNSGRENVLESFELTKSEFKKEKLYFPYVRLLRSDKVRTCRLEVKDGISNAIRKNISSTVAKTNNLTSIHLGSSFISGTKFKNFNLQQEREALFVAPFEVNPTAA